MRSATAVRRPSGEGGGRGSGPPAPPDINAETYPFEVVQRLGGYDGYGTADAPVRMAAHRRRRQAAPVPAPR